MIKKTLIYNFIFLFFAFLYLNSCASPIPPDGEPGFYHGLEKSNLNKVNFINSNLKRVNFKKSNMIKVNFKKANLNSANFIKSVLDEVKFIEANLTDANFSSAILKAVSFHGAKFCRTKMPWGIENPICE